jgi:hypothetical protein
LNYRDITRTIAHAGRSAWLLALALALLSCGHATPPTAPGRAYYVDCSAAQNGAGTQAHPWNALSSLAATTFRPGDQLLFRRGTSCEGMLAPKGSGSSVAPIVMDAYGAGVPPIINGGLNEEAVKLFNQQYWEIRNLEIVGGNRYGVFISGDRPNSSLNHIYLRDLNVHGAAYHSKLRSDSGEVVIATAGLKEVLNDVLVDSVSAHDTTASQGISISAGGSWTGNWGAPQALGNNITVQNSTAYNVGGDGILISEATNGLLQNNVVHHTGLCASCKGSTPNGLWEWYCHKCTVQFNESYANKSWLKTDGGDFDIDYYDDDNIVQYNYGHDSAGYCISVFGSDGSPSRNNIVRYNICSNDGQSRAGAFQGEIFLHTWNGGSLDGVQIYNNTLYWNPAVNAPAFNTAGVTYAGSGPKIFMNNVIYSTVAGMVETTSDFVLDRNLYWTTGAGEPTFQIGRKVHASFAAYQAASHQDARSRFTDPLLADPAYHSPGRPSSAFKLLPGSPAFGAGADVCAAIPGCTMGARDFFGAPLRDGAARDIGAN